MSTMTLPGLRVVLINLDRSLDRRSVMEARLAEIGLPHVRIAAVDGQARWDALFPTVDVSAFQRNVGRDVMPGEIGCYHSHLQAWQGLLESKHDTLLVLEDDVVFGTDFRQALALGLEHRGEWDLLKLNKVRAKQPVRQRKLGPYSLNAYIGPATGTGAYLIQRHVVEHLLPRMLPIKRPIDHELERVHVLDYRLFGLEPFPSEVRDGQQSTITGNNFSTVRKYRWYRRLPAYRQRLGTLLFRTLYLARKGRLFAPFFRN